MADEKETQDIARQLKQQLEARKIDRKSEQRIRNYLLRSLSLPITSTRSNNSLEIDKLGTTLWNAVTRLHREGPEHCPATSFALIRAFAYSLLDRAHRSACGRNNSSNTEGKIRVLGTSLKAARTCIEHIELDVCTSIFQTTAHHVAALTGDGGQVTLGTDNDPTQEVAKRMANEFWILRAGLSWKQNRLDTADYYLTKTTMSYENDDDLVLVEKYADITYEIGRDLLRMKQYAKAITWLGRSCDVLDQVESERLAPDTSELRMSAIHDLVKALLATKEDAALSRAADLIAFLETEFGNKIAIAQLKLALLSCKDEIPAEDYRRVIATILTSSILTDGIFKTIMHHVQKLKTLDSDMAASTLNQFLAVRLYEAGNMVYVEKAVVTRIWIAASTTTDMQGVISLAGIVDESREALNQTFSSEAAHAAQTLIWKCIESATSTGQTELANAWCRLARHSLFDKAGELNKCKLSRKMIVGAMSRGDIVSAREAFFQMPESGKNIAATRYLMYRVALQSQDEALATESLDVLMRNPDQDSTYLYACILESQKCGDRHHTVMLMKKVLERYNYAPPGGIYLPALLRCTAQMLMSSLDHDVNRTEIVLKEVCKIFEAAVTQEERFRSASQTDAANYKAEISWFSKNAYNLALKNCSVVHSSLINRLLTVCVALIGLLHPGSQAEEKKSLYHREAMCHFIASSALTVLARSEDNVQCALQNYLGVRKHVKAFFEVVSKQSEVASHASDKENMLAKKSQLLRFELEAILKLEKWDDLDKTFDRCLEEGGTDHFETLADLVIVIHTHMTGAKVDRRHHEKIPAVMQRIINQSWRSGRSNVDKLARWLRCMFRMTVPSSRDIGLQIVDQATSIASRTQNYPQDELEWLASSAFNQAVDCHCASDEAGCTMWGEKALNLAKTSPSNPGLYNQMQGLWMRLKASDM